MHHYIIKSHDYDAFKDTQDLLEDLKFEAEDVSEICEEKPKRLNVWLTKGIYHLLKIEVLAIATIVIAAYLFTNALALPTLMFLVFAGLFSLFSIWITGMLGLDKLYYYSQCQDYALGERHPLVMLVNVEAKDSQRVEGMLNNQPSVSYKLLT